MSFYNHPKFKSLPALLRTLKARKKSKKKIVFTNGCFDILHVGHIRYLQKARALGDILVVALNTDASVKRLKGNKRPITHEKDRVEVLGALSCVDFIILFSEDTPLRLIEAIRPDFLVKGGDWKKEQIVGNKIVSSYNGKVLSLPYIPGFSTTGLIGKIKKAL